jgi:hypothetical protein
MGTSRRKVKKCGWKALPNGRYCGAKGRRWQEESKGEVN